MQLCESCGACRETEWRVCPFCQTQLSTTSEAVVSDGEQFDALAAVAETSAMEVLPSPTPDEPEEEADLLTEHDLAHLTGGTGPAVNGWESSTPPPPGSDNNAESSDGIDAPVSKFVVIPLVAAALAAVAFVGYSILTTSPAARPDTVALIDRAATTLATTTTTEAPLTEPGIGRVGVDVAEQAASMCAGQQFSIARAEMPSLAIYNDLLPVTRDGRDDWIASPDHITLRTEVPALLGCLTTADGGEIDRCPTNGYVISRRSVSWSYRVLQTTDGAELGSDSGTAQDVLSCEQLEAEAAGENFASWSPLPQDRLDAVAAAQASAPHPNEACAVEATPLPADEATTVEQPLTTGLALHATFANVTDVDVQLPEGWIATEDRPVDAVLCLEHLDAASDEAETAPAEPTDTVETTETADPATTVPADAAGTPSDPADEACASTIRVTAMHRDGRFLGSWDYEATECGDGVEPTSAWWLDVVGPALGYQVEVEDSTDGE